LPDADADRAAMRITPRTLLCASAWLAGGSMADTGFDELRNLASAAGDKVSLAMGMAGWLVALVVHARFDEASKLASELTNLLESIGDPTLTLALLYSAIAAKIERGEMTETVRLAERVIDLADGDATKGNLILGCPLSAATILRGCARCFLGDSGWRDDIDQAATIARGFDATLLALVLLFKYFVTVTNGVWVPDAKAMHETAELLELAERSGDNFTLACARYVRGVALTAYEGAQREDGFALLAAARDAALQERFSVAMTTLVDTHVANQRIRAGDLDGAIELARAAVEEEYACGEMIVRAAVTAALVEPLLRRGGHTDVQQAEAAVDRLAALPTEPGFVMHDIWLLRMRALLASARGDDVAYRDYRDRYRTMANSLGFDGHIAWAEAMA
jgi:adenylate cyclase